MDSKASDTYWRSTKYRSPDEAIVKSYVSSKLGIIKRFIDFGGMSILDVGCGNGTFTHYFALLGHTDLQE